MAYDEQLAARVRETLQGRGPVEEKAMFGGRGFLVGGSLAVCASHDGGLLVRVDAADQEALLGEHVVPMEMGARTSRTWVRVAPGDLGPGRLEAWVERGTATAEGLAR
jgi:TfoX/Sxy family transcriptional regulator of competence genes